MSDNKELIELHSMILSLPKEYVQAYKELVDYLVKELDRNLSTDDENLNAVVITAYLDLMEYLQAKLEGKE